MNIFFLSVEYSVKDKCNDLAKHIILNSISKYDCIHVKHCKEMLDKLQNLYFGGKLHFSKMEKNEKDSTFIVVRNQSFPHEESKP